MKLNDMFYEAEYSKAFEYAEASDLTIVEIEPDDKGRRFQIVEIPKPTQKELDEQEISKFLQKLEETDYVANKLAEATALYMVNGDRALLDELTTYYSDILQQRQTWRERVDELKEHINEVK